MLVGGRAEGWCAMTRKRSFAGEWKWGARCSAPCGAGAQHPAARSLLGRRGGLSSPGGVLSADSVVFRKILPENNFCNKLDKSRLLAKTCAGASCFSDFILNWTDLQIGHSNTERIRLVEGFLPCSRALSSTVTEHYCGWQDFVCTATLLFLLLIPSVSVLRFWPAG